MISLNSVARETPRRWVMMVCLATFSTAFFPVAHAGGDEIGDDWEKSSTTSGAVAARAGGGNVTISGWATFSGQVMAGAKDPDDDSTSASDDVDGAEIIGSDFIYRPENEDFFWRLELTKIPVVGGGIGGASLVGSLTTTYGLAFTIKGDSYQIRAARLPANVPPDVEDPDPLGHAFGLFTCTETTCEQEAVLKGGYGTTGERIVVALPLKVLRDAGTKVKEGDTASDFLAYAALAPYHGPISETQFFDSVRVSPASMPVPVKSVSVTVGKKTAKATLKDGYFNAPFPASLFRRSPTTVKTKTCLGKDCVRQSFKVRK